MSISQLRREALLERCRRRGGDDASIGKVAWWRVRALCVVRVSGTNSGACVRMRVSMREVKVAQLAYEYICEGDGRGEAPRKVILLLHCNVCRLL